MQSGKLMFCRTSDKEQATRCIKRTKMMGYRQLVVTNLFAFRATDPQCMMAADDPIGPANDAFIQSYAAISDCVICAWGNDGSYRDRSKHVVAMLRKAGVSLWALKLSQTGEPCHPLYLPYQLEPGLWTPKAS